jgi:hypothetical protein
VTTAFLALGRVVVDHPHHVGDVDAARGDVGGVQRHHFAALEAGESGDRRLSDRSTVADRVVGPDTGPNRDRREVA